MEQEEQKCVLVMDGALPLGILANTAGILGITLGKHIPQAVGPDVTDRSGNTHLGIIRIPVPVLRADREQLRSIRARLFQPDFSSLIAVDFSDVAQSCNEYGDFIQKAAETEEADTTYFGIGICGKKKLVNKLTGSLPLLR